MDNAIPTDVIDEQDVGWARQRIDRGPTPTRRRIAEGDDGQTQGSGHATARGRDGMAAVDPAPMGPRSS
eukprot:652306-Lingulodinium_polyedra.AAC.1